jgi:hypothetical protein
VIANPANARQRHSKTMRSLALAALLVWSPVAAKEFLIPATQAIVDGAALKVAPGDELLLAAGERGPLTLRNIVGAPGRVITIRPAGGRVVVRAGAGTEFAVLTRRSSHFRLTGEGGGLEITGAKQGLRLDDLSTDFEVDHLEIHHVGFAGIMAKTDPTADPATQRAAFTMRNVSFHHNDVHHTGGEGFYIGHSFYDTGRKVGGGQVFPHAIEGLRVYANRTRHTAADGIQISTATVDCEIFDNVIEDYGEKPFDAYQNTGLMIGPGTGGEIHHNVIRRGTGNGITLLGLGDFRVENNFIGSAGEHGIFSDARPPATNARGSRFVKNTIVAPRGDAIRLFYPTTAESPHVVAENRLIAPGSGVFIGQRSRGVLVQSRDNITVAAGAATAGAGLQAGWGERGGGKRGGSRRSDPSRDAHAATVCQRAAR